MATTIRWIDNSSVEQGHRIYKSDTYFTKDNLPPMLVELGPDVEEYVDEDGEDGENWYIVSAFIGDYEVFSEPFISGLFITAFIHDVFGDGSAVATYQFDGDATDLGGNYDLPEDNISFTDGIISEAARINGGASLSGFNTDTGEVSVSMWVRMNETINDNRGIIHIGYSGGAIEVGIDGGQIGVASPITGSSSLSFFGDIPQDEWIHLSVSYDGDEASAYIDGEKKQFSGSTNYYGSSSGLILGRRSHNNNVIDTTFDQLRIFNRVLTEEEVQALYQEGAMFL